VPGFLLVGGGLSMLQFALENVGHPVVPRSFVFVFAGLAVALLLIFRAYAKRHDDPAVDLSLFEIRTFRVSTMAGGFSRIGINAIPFMLPLLFQIGFGLSPVQSGSLTFVLSLGAMAVRPISLRLLRELGFRGLLTANGVVCSIVIAAFALTTAETPHWVIFLHVMAFSS
jgi:nitrate/nitrite transporter NarK